MTVAGNGIAKGIRIRTGGLHHVALRSTDIARSRVFYIERLGFPVLLENGEIFTFSAGGNVVAVRGPDAQTVANDMFSPFRFGLDHIALTCVDEDELRRAAGELTAAGINNTGVQVDATLGTQYVAFKDPDGISWELYSA